MRPWLVAAGVVSAASALGAFVERAGAQTAGQTAPDAGAPLAICRSAATRLLATCKGDNSESCPQQWAWRILACGQADPAGLAADVATWRAADEAQHPAETSLATTMRFTSDFEAGSTAVDAQPRWFERASVADLEATESGVRAIFARVADERTKEGKRTVQPDREVAVGMALRRAAFELQCRADRACLAKRASLRDAGQ